MNFIELFDSVVTGVRFAEGNRAIFLQIQVGKLMQMGLVDPNTLYWMEYPSNTNDYVSIDYDFPHLSLTDSLKFSSRNEVVTGNLMITSS